MRNRRSQKVGIAFSDFVTEQNFFNTKPKRSSPQRYSPLQPALPLFILASLFLVLMVRLFYVQIVQGAYYTGLSDANRTKTVVIPASRGIIFDRYMQPLVRNVPVFEILEGKKAKILDKDEALELIHQGKNVRQTVSREYLYKDVFTHVLGYIGQISFEELQNEWYKDYTISDFVGKMGLERTYENVLHGQNGKELYEVNARGTKIRFLGRKEPVSGQNIETTLDIDIEKSVEKAMKDVEKGAVVVSDPRDGGILAIYSKPTFDNNLFTHGKNYDASGDYQTVENILSDTDNQPLLDRAIGGAYPPGSTFKLVNAAAGLMSGSLKKDTIIEDTGSITVGGATFGNWYFLQYGRREGPLNVVSAIKRSNDIFFYKAAQAEGVDLLSDWAKKFGLGNKLGIDLPGEVTGTVPTEEWKKKVVGDNWYLGDTFNYGIGQGYLLTTPLQVNFWTTVFANGGMLYKPHILKTSPVILAKNLVSADFVKTIATGMKESCSPGGVAWPLFQFRVQNSKLRIDGRDFTEQSSGSAKLTQVALGCKTGTAEVGGKGTLPDAWITVMAPFYNPEIVVTVLVENGGEGSSVAGPIAKEILTSYFEKK